jgi:oxalate decarboxylase/phosphoglucose isomerase-like protein (cupin superfamily)
MTVKSDATATTTNLWWESAYDRWLASQDVPVYSGYHIEDVRSLKLDWWSLRQCPGAVLNLVGHQGVTEAHVLEIPPGQTLPPFRMALEEAIYVPEGQGLATVWAEGRPRITFEWQKHSLFRIPSNYFYQLTNARGDRPARTLHVSYLPSAMSIQPDPNYFFNNPYLDSAELYREESNFYSAEARAVREEVKRGEKASVTYHWYANFFPDLTVWDRLKSQGSRGGGARSAGIQFPNSCIRTGLMVLPARRYKKAHRHGPGVTIVGISEGEGYVVMWPEGGERVVCPWREGTVFVPPNHWYHQHVNTGPVQNRQLRIFPPRPMMGYNIRDMRQQIEYVDEDAWIRKKFEEELAKNRLTSLMPEEAYRDPAFKFDDEEMQGD